MDISFKFLSIKKLRQLVIAVLVVAVLFLAANLARYERLDNKACSFDSFCYTVFDRWKQRICYVLQDGIACSKEEVIRLETGPLTDEEVGFSSSYSPTDISAIISGGAIIVLIILHFWNPKKRKQGGDAISQSAFYRRIKAKIAAAPMFFYISIKNLWIDEITNEDQARRIIQRASRYAFWYWFLSASLFNSQINKMKPELRSIDPASLTPFETMILSPVFVLGAGATLISALACCYIMKKKNSRAAATTLLILWTFQAWLRATYLQPSLIWTPLFIFVVWTTARGLLATNKIVTFKKNSRGA